MRKVKAAIEYMDRLRKMQDAGIEQGRNINGPVQDIDSLPTLDQRVHSIFNLINSLKRPVGNMLFFVMYDIESNKVRYNIVKYLIRKG